MLFLILLGLAASQSASPSPELAHEAAHAADARPDPAAAQRAFDTAILAELNFARLHPKEYADRLRNYRLLFTGNIVHFPGIADGLVTQEGPAAVDEAIAFLEKQPALPPLTESDLLSRAAGDHVADQGPKGATGHVSSDGADPSARVEKRGGGPYVAETISYGPATAADVIRDLIVDDNVPDRGHRTILFTGDLRFAGIACGPHSTYRMMCVADFSETKDGR